MRQARSGHRTGAKASGSGAVRHAVTSTVARIAMLIDGTAIILLNDHQEDSSTLR